MTATFEAERQAAACGWVLDLEHPVLAMGDRRVLEDVPTLHRLHGELRDAMPSQ